MGEGFLFDPMLVNVKGEVSSPTSVNIFGRTYFVQDWTENDHVHALGIQENPTKPILTRVKERGIE
jgi:hypothetical protein